MVISHASRGSDSTIEFTPLLFTRSVLDEPDDYLLCEVTDRVCMMIDGGVGLSNLPPRAVQAHHLDIYYGQIFNGGHKQLICNTRDQLPLICADTRKAFKEIKAIGHLEILDDFESWIKANPREVEALSNSDSNIPAALEQFDDRFFKENRKTPLAQSTAKWIRGWDELQLVDNASEALNDLVAKTPEFQENLNPKQIEQIDFWLSDEMRAPVGLLLFRQEDPSFPLFISPGFPIGSGKNAVGYWQVDTNREKVDALFHKNSTIVFERQSEHETAPTGLFRRFVESAQKALTPPKPGYVGRPVGKTSNKEVAGYVALAKELKAAAAIHLLLRSASLNPNGLKSVVHAAPKENGPSSKSANFAVLVGHSTYYVHVTEDEAFLYGRNNSAALNSVSAQEIFQYHSNYCA